VQAGRHVYVTVTGLVSLAGTRGMWWGTCTPAGGWDRGRDWGRAAREQAFIDTVGAEENTHQHVEQLAVVCSKEVSLPPSNLIYECM
jgi:hypothetical protein